MLPNGILSVYIQINWLTKKLCFGWRFFTRSQSLLLLSFSRFIVVLTWWWVTIEKHCCSIFNSDPKIKIATPQNHTYRIIPHTRIYETAHTNVHAQKPSKADTVNFIVLSNCKYKTPSPLLFSCYFFSSFQFCKQYTLKQFPLLRFFLRFLLLLIILFLFEIFRWLSYFYFV